MMRRHRLLQTLLVLLALVLPGCASMPTSGPVQEGQDLQLERDDRAVRPIGQPPAPGAKPEDIVLGFLRAGVDFERDHAVARQYLAPSVRERWRPSAGAALYERAGGELSATAGPGDRVRVEAIEVGRIDRDGRYRATPATRLQRMFRMTRVDGEWRIAELADGLLLARSAVPEIYRQLNLYFPAPGRKVLVPDTVFLPAMPGLSTKLVNRLMRGPSAALRTSVTTGFPTGTSLAVSSVPIRDGVATVRLDATAGKADETARERMSAQLVWTLKQLPEFQALRVTVENEPMVVSGVPDPQPATAWLNFNPAVLAETAAAYVVHEGRVAQLVRKEVVPLTGPAAPPQPVRSVAVSLDEARLAAVSADGRTLLVGTLRPASAPTPRMQGGDLSPPSWDSVGNVWVADASAGRLWVLPPGAEAPVAVTFDAAEEIGPITRVRVARDGARVALLAGRGASSRLYVAAVIRSQDEPAVEITAYREVLPDLTRVLDVSWLDATRFVVIGQFGDAPEVVDAPAILDVTGYTYTFIEPASGLVTIAAGPPPHPIVAGTKAGRVQQYTANGPWSQLGIGSSPAYPG